MTDPLIRCFYFTAPLELCWHNNLYRTYLHHIESDVATSSISTEESKLVSTSIVDSIASDATTAPPPESQVRKTKSITTSKKAVQAIEVNNLVFFTLVFILVCVFPTQPLPPHAFLSYRSKFEEPSLEEGFREIKRINFIFDDSNGEPVNDDAETASTDKKMVWTKRKIWEMWLETDKIGWMSS